MSEIVGKNIKGVYRLRAAIIIAGRAAFKTWREIAEEVTAAEGNTIKPSSLLIWASRKGLCGGHRLRFDHAAALAMVRAGATYQETGMRFGVSRERVRQICRHEETPVPTSRAGRAARNERFLALLRDGVDIKDAARKRGVSEWTARNIAVRGGVGKLTRRRAKRTAELAPLVELVRNGMSIRQAAGAHHNTAERLRLECQRLGVKSQTWSRWNRDAVSRGRRPVRPETVVSP